MEKSVLDKPEAGIRTKRRQTIRVSINWIDTAPLPQHDMTCRPSVRPLSRRLPRPMARICLRWFSKPPPSGTRDNGSLDRCRDIEAFDSEPKAWLYQEAETDRSTFAVISLWGKFGGLYACAATFLYIVPLLNIFLTRLF